MEKKKKKKTRSRKKDQFVKFAKLKVLIAHKCQETVKNEMCKLHTQYRDEMCSAVIHYVKTGEETNFYESLVMRRMFKKLTNLIIIK